MMPTLYSWSVRRSGAAMTITHSCGRVVNVERIEPNDCGNVVAYKADGSTFRLAAVTHLGAVVR